MYTIHELDRIGNKPLPFEGKQLSGRYHANGSRPVSLLAYKHGTSSGRSYCTLVRLVSYPQSMTESTSER